LLCIFGFLSVAFVFAVVVGQVVGTTPKGNLKVKYALGAGVKDKLVGVCSTAFASV
jgi:hypothetical protein